MRRGTRSRDVGRTAGIALLSYAVIQTSNVAWSSPKTIGILIGAAVLIVYFIVHEAFLAKQPLLPFSLFKNRWVTSSNLIMALGNAGLYLATLFLPLYMQQVMGYSPWKAGLATLPMALLLLVFAGVGQVLVGGRQRCEVRTQRWP